MKKLARTAASLLALVLASAAAFAVPRLDPEELPLCDELLPAVLRVAIPSRAAPASDLGEVRRTVEAALRPYLENRSRSPLEGSSDCRGTRRIQINIAVGSDYEVLDWLSEGEVDGALAAPLTLWLLERDETRFLEIERSASPADNPEVRFSAGRRQGNSVAGFWLPDPDPMAVLEGYREHLFCQALAARDEATALVSEGLRRCEARPEEERRQVVRPVMPDHLSTSGFVLPMSSNSIWLERRIIRLGGNLLNAGDKRSLLPKIRNAFWRGWMKDLRFSLDHDPFDRMNPETKLSTPPSAARSLDIPCCSPGWSEDRQEMTEILFTGEPLRQRPGQGQGQGQAGLVPDPYESSLFPDNGATVLVRDRWVLLHGALEDNFRDASRARRERLPVERVPPGFKAILEPRAYRANGTVEVLPPPTELASLLEVNSRFGIRSMAFTPDEALRLIHAQKTTHEGPFSRLALILPGGGVKSAYQAVLLDRLYGSGSLRNFLVEEPPDVGQRPLDVHQVIGTSGGALTGFFVAQLGPRGPWSLTELLWHQGPKKGAPPLKAGEKSQPLRSKDIFGFTDLPRYLSIVVNFFIFCILLVFVVYRERLKGHRRSQGEPSGRFRVTMILWGVLLAAPLLLQMASAGGYREHVPEIEGVAYMLLVLFVSMADQCLVFRRDEPSVSFWIHWRVPVLTGAALLLLPVGLQLFLFLQKTGSDWHPSRGTEELALMLAGKSASVGLVFFLLTVFVIVGGLAIPLRRLRSSWTGGLRSVAAAAFDGFACSALALILFSSQAVRGRAAWKPPLLLSVLIVLVLTLLLLAVLRPLMKRKGFASWVPYYLSLFGVSAIIFYLCLPENPGASEALGPVLLAPSGLDVFGGHLMVMIGSLILTAGLVQALIQGRNGYRLEGETRFIRGLLLLLAHAAAVLVAMFFLDWLMTKATGHFALPITTLELDWRYWAVSIAFAAFFGLILLGLRKQARWQPVARLLRGPKNQAHVAPSRFRAVLGETRRWSAMGFIQVIRVLRHSALFLLENHPNRPLVSIRAFRVVLIGAGAVLWWNLLLAPAAYGNKKAESTLKKTIVRFETAYEEAHGAGPSDPRPPHQRAGGLQPRFQAHFVSPANELEEDGTRFFLFSPAEAEECPEVPRRSRSGSQWLAYRVFQGTGAQQRVFSGGLVEPCSPLDAGTTVGRDFLSSVIFASGSPFPIFAPHRVQEPSGEGEPMILVDGGYSNNVPVEAALELDARQVLILRSSHPSPAKQEGGLGGVVMKRLGPLVSNLPRIPAFLFERSQQVDRLSSQGVFVVSLAPLPSHQSWPSLFHFQKNVVERLEKVAEEDMKERIGFVESWGRPEARLSLTLEEPARGGPPRTLNSP